MNISNIIQNDIYSAMKSGDKFKSNSLRTALAKVKEKQINERKKLDDKEIIKVLRALVKQRDESIKLFEQAGRLELVKNERLEKQYLEKYLPKMLSEREVEIIALDVLKDTKATSLKDIGKIMPEIMKRGKGSIDGNIAQQIVKSLLKV